MTLDEFQNLWGDVLGLIPMSLVPFLQGFNLVANLDVKFDVLSQSGK